MAHEMAIPAAIVYSDRIALTGRPRRKARDDCILFAQPRLPNEGSFEAPGGRSFKPCMFLLCSYRATRTRSRVS
jgi:hypothetical protein